MFKKACFIPLLIICLLYGCKSSNKGFYSYQVNAYSLEGKRKILLSPCFLMSYKDYLFEFKTTIKQNDIIDGETGIVHTTITYDTTGVYVMCSMKPDFFEFDTFAFNNKIRKSGPWEEKEFGSKLVAPSKNYSLMSSGYDYGKPADTLINNINCVYFPMVKTDRSVEDTIAYQMMAIKNKALNSLYKIQGVKFKDGKYCIIGFNFYNLVNKDSFCQEIEGLRPLTEREKDICERMIKKAKEYKQ